MFNWFKSQTDSFWNLQSKHKTWRIRNHLININDEYILYSTDHDAGENGIVEYYVKTDEYIVYKYPEDMTPTYHSYCRYQNHIYLILIDGSIITFNIRSKSFARIQNIKNKQSIGRYASCFNIDDYLIHIIGGQTNKYHLIYSTKHNQYHLRQRFDIIIENPCIVRLHAQNKVLMFNGYHCKECFEGSVIMHPGQHHKEITWTISQTLKIPDRLKHCGYISCGPYVGLFGGYNGTTQLCTDNVYFIHLTDNDKYGYIEKLKHVKCPSRDKYHAIYIDHKVHIFGLTNDRNHYSVSLQNICPHLAIAEYDQTAIEHSPRLSAEEHNEEEKESVMVTESGCIHCDSRMEKVKNVSMKGLQKQIEAKDKLISSLYDENHKLKTALKDIELQLIECQRQLRVQSQHAFDVSQYEKWNAQQIVDWIVSLENGLFDVYSDVLLKNLEAQMVEGHDLEDNNKHPFWKEMGIDKLKDRKILIPHISDLIGNKNDMVAHKSNYTENEGFHNNTEYIL